jgi:hypothetical protein
LYRITAEFEKINDSLLRSEKQFEVAGSKANESVLSMLEENKVIAEIHKKNDPEQALDRWKIGCPGEAELIQPVGRRPVRRVGHGRPGHP